MDNPSAYYLQLVDCNCNNCGYMLRDLAQWKEWHDWRRAQEEAAFEIAKAKAIKAAEAIEDDGERRGMLYHANKMRFLFDKSGLIQYGTCQKFNKPVSFLPNTCQIETQGCFVHRKDLTANRRN